MYIVSAIIKLTKNLYMQFKMNKWYVKKKSKNYEERGVQELNLWIVDNWCDDEVRRRKHHENWNN